MAKIYKRNNDVVHHDLDTGLYAEITFEELITNSGNHLYVKNLKTYDHTWSIPDGYVQATQADWDYAKTRKLIAYINTLT